MKYYAGSDVSLEGEAGNPLNAICVADETLIDLELDFKYGLGVEVQIGVVK